MRSFVGHKNWLKSVRFSHDSETIATGGYDKSLKIWDLETGKMKQEFMDHKGVVNAVRYLPDNNCLASCSEDKTIRIYDLRISTLLQFYTGHYGAVNDISFHNSGHYMVSVSKDSYAKLWDLRNGRPMYKIEAHQDSVNCCQFAYRGDTFLTGGSDKGIIGWDYDFSASFEQPEEEHYKSSHDFLSQEASQTNINHDFVAKSQIPKSKHMKSTKKEEREIEKGPNMNSGVSGTNSYTDKLMETKDLLMSYSGNQENYQSMKYDSNAHKNSSLNLNQNNAVSQVYPSSDRLRERQVETRQCQPQQPIMQLDPQINNKCSNIVPTKRFEF